MRDATNAGNVALNTAMTTAYERLIERLDRLRSALRSQRLRRAALLPAALIFAGGLVLSIRLLPDDVGLIAPAQLISIALVGVPIRLAVAVWELRINAVLVGARIAWADAFRATLFATAANMLPLPGGALVRATALKVAGATMFQSGAVTALSGLAWLAMAFLCGGYFVVDSNVAVGGGFLAVGLAAACACTAGLFRSGQSVVPIGLLYAAKIAVIAIGVMRLKWAFAALGVDAELSQLAVFAIANVTGAFIAIVPAGLGVNEAVAAALAPLTGLDASTAFLATGLNRLVAMPILVLATLLASKSVVRLAGLSRER